jgi:hypothetical protein
MGGAGDSPAPVGPSSVALRRVDGSPDGTGESPVLPRDEFSGALVNFMV